MIRRDPDQAGDKSVMSGPPPLAIAPRNMRFGRARRPTRWWLNDDPVATAWHNALSACFPRGEAFFCETLNRFRGEVPPVLAAEIRGFCAQEMCHAREHDLFNRTAAEAGYDMTAIDRAHAEHIARNGWRSPVFNLGATMALEHFTATTSHEYLARPAYLQGAEAEVGHLWMWHSLEEIEHKGVAYDTWLHVTRDWSRWKRWSAKAKISVAVVAQFLAQRIRDTLHLLEQDGITGWRARARLYSYLFLKPGLLRRQTLDWVRYLLPGFHPWNRDDQALVAGAERQLRAALA